MIEPLKTRAFEIAQIHERLHHSVKLHFIE